MNMSGNGSRSKEGIDAEDNGVGSLKHCRILILIKLD